MIIPVSQKALNKIIESIHPVSFTSLVYPESVQLSDELKSLVDTYPDFATQPTAVSIRIKQLRSKLKAMKVTRDMQVLAVARHIKDVAKYHPIRYTTYFFYVWDYGYWHKLDEMNFTIFLSECAYRMGVPTIEAGWPRYRRDLLDCAKYEMNQDVPVPELFSTYISMLNGYVKINKSGATLIEPDPDLFMTYRLKYKYDPDADCPLFKKFFNRVRPGEDWQKIIMEYVGYIFSNGLKMERAMLFYGTGSNGKSVFFETVQGLVGRENCTAFSLEGLTDDAGNQRAAIADKLLNYSSEISKKMNVDIFKQLISGEPVQARWLYKDVVIIRKYAKLIFNCNELPMSTDSTNAYYRRLILVPFEETISEEEKDIDLHVKLIGRMDQYSDDLIDLIPPHPEYYGELSGIFNLAIEGLMRLYNNRRFSETSVTKAPVNQYVIESNSALMFFDEIGLNQDETGRILNKELYIEYQTWCIQSGYKHLSIRNFTKMLRQHQYKVVRHGFGMMIYASRNNHIQSPEYETHLSKVTPF